MENATSRKKLLFVGGGHAHLTCLQNVSQFVKKGIQVTLISPVRYHYYSGMGPGLLSEIYQPDQVRFDLEKMVTSQGGTLIYDKATHFNPIEKLVYLESGKKVNYDVVSFNTGSQIEQGFPIDANSHNFFPIKPIENFQLIKETIKNLIQKQEESEKPLHFVIIGGGPAGIESAASLSMFLEARDVNFTISIFTGSNLLKSWPTQAQQHVKKIFAQKKIQIHNTTVKKIQDNQVFSNDNMRVSFDLGINASGIQVGTIFKDSNVELGSAKELLVNQYLQSTQYSNVFGGGDCIAFQKYLLDKVGVYAVRENPILLNNILAMFGHAELKPFQPQKSYLLILNLGYNYGVFCWKKLVFTGKIAFWIKNNIDRRFMKQFQDL